MCVSFDFHDGVFNKFGPQKNGNTFKNIEIRLEKSKKASWLKNDRGSSLLSDVQSVTRFDAY